MGKSKEERDLDAQINHNLDELNTLQKALADSKKKKEQEGRNGSK